MARASLPLAPLVRARLFSILVSFACVLGSLLRAVPSPFGEVTFFDFLGLGLSTCCYAWLCACFHHSVALYDMYYGSAPGTSDVLLSIMCFRDRHVPFIGVIGSPISSARLCACASLVLHFSVVLDTDVFFPQSGVFPTAALPLSSWIAPLLIPISVF